MDINDKLTFTNKKGETYQMSRQEFRNAAKGLQHLDHRPQTTDLPIPNLQSGLDYVQKANANESNMFTLTHINNQPTGNHQSQL
jgi:hypothetical protein